jgi:hypothetical protein
MRSLKICLWIAGILCLLSGFGLFLPLSVLESFANAFGVQAFPDSPLFVYVVRVMSAMAVVMGAYLIILALHPMKYPALIPFTGLAAVFLGLVCGITGLAAGMYTLWFVGDSLSCLIFGGLIFAFWQQAKQTSGP